MKINIKILQLLLFSALLVSVSSSQIKKKAQVGFRFLENPVSAEVMGKGGIGVVGLSNSNAVFWNPALLGQIDNPVDISFNHTRSIADMNYNAGAAAFKLGDFGIIALSLMAMDYGDFYGTVRAANDQGYTETGTFSPSAYAAGIAFSQQITDRFSYGVHIKYARQDLGEAYISTGTSFEDSTFSLSTVEYDKGIIAMDVGAYYDFLFKGITFGASLQNISPEVKYELHEFPLPFSVSFGATIEPLQIFMQEVVDHKIVISIESKHPRDFGEKVKFGAEYSFLDMLAARVGYQSNYDERDLTAGVGFRKDISGHPIRIDYAFERFGLFGDRHFISVGIGY
ncbi:MAG: PorV/PorQ family protein [Ignavibacteriae bacterium]|nr:hypothetical protein [Ignavibacteriota bacterium]NOG96679.1 PorV/PorQ family protein [Ignavibacteriota bacterium]